MTNNNPRVTGEMDQTLNEFERACLVLILEEQEKISPNNALISTLCNAVRLKREYGRFVSLMANLDRTEKESQC